MGKNVEKILESAPWRKKVESFQEDLDGSNFYGREFWGGSGWQNFLPQRPEASAMAGEPDRVLEGGWTMDRRGSQRSCQKIRLAKDHAALFGVQRLMLKLLGSYKLMLLGTMRPLGRSKHLPPGARILQPQSLLWKRMMLWQSPLLWPRLLPPSAEEPMPPTPTMEGSDPELREVAEAMVTQAGSLEHVSRWMLRIVACWLFSMIQEHETPEAHPPVLE